ncbi:MAG: enoyl-CoA hydratase-related protein [Acidimicrobiia bacterium]|nr:enoyl-CoA hydratase-related protein [Acidimicrobiia bacterium]MDH3396633.1 enoyl-CoA hydratase-related protein [Acidimicrobiia bacterium]
MSLVEYSVDGNVARIVLNRPPVNALSAELSADLTAAFTEAADPRIRAVMVTGEPHFAAGADIKGFQVAYDRGSEDSLAADLGQAVRLLETLEKPTIAAVRGFALGGGLELAMGADFRYFADDARVGQPEILLGLIPGAGGTQRLPRLVGYQRAKEIIFSGRHLGAEEAIAIGLADKVLPAAQLLEAAMADAERWAAGPTLAYGAARRALNDALRLPIEPGLRAEVDAFQACFRTDDAREGVAAFIDKRAARFTGS